MNKVLVMSLVLLAILTPLLSPPIYAIDKGTLWTKYLVLYRRTADLGRQGINVSSIVNELIIVLELINKGDKRSLERADELLNTIENKVINLERNADNILLVRNLKKYGIAAVMLSIPLLFYLLFPRLYLIIWFRIRRRWIVEK